MIDLPLEKRYRHDCTSCVYRGSTYPAPTRHVDWYTCRTSVLARQSDQDSDYLSADAQFAGAVDFAFIREAFRLGILTITIVPIEQQPTNEPY